MVDILPPPAPLEPMERKKASQRSAMAVTELQERLRSLNVETDGCSDVVQLRAKLRERLKQQQWPFNLRRLSERTFVIVENDDYGEAPHIYLVLGAKKVIIIDTGCDTADLREFLWTIPELDGREFQVINTHIHYDHIMGNARFCESRGTSLCGECLCICQGSRNRAFSENWEQTSLQHMFNTSPIRNFCVTDWLQEGDRIYLDDDHPSEEESLEVFYTPGHTPDSISLYLPAENRLFTGDLIYPGSIYLYLPGSDLREFADSIKKLGELVDSKPAGLVFSCGHITPNLPATALKELSEILPTLLSRTGTPQISGKHAVFQTKSFTLICRQDDVVF